MPSTTVQQIGGFAIDARPEHLKDDVRALLKRNILDSVGCSLGALPGRPFRELREHFEVYRGGLGACTLIGGGSASPDQAALYNSGLVRYVDLLDSYMSPGGLCHPADNFAGVLASAEAAKASGEDFMMALAVAYEIGCRFTAAVPVMGKGFNHALQLSMSLAAACSRLEGLSADQTAHAVAIAGIDNVSLSAVHSEPVSMWKGFSPGVTAMRAVYIPGLAKRGFTGPLRLFEGPNGLERMFDQPIRIDWSDPSLQAVRKTVMKSFCSLIHGQPVLEAVMALRRKHDLAAADVASVRLETFQTGYDIAGGGVFGPKDHPTTKEQGDYNLKYLIAAALLDGQVGPAQLEESRINAPDAQALLARVSVEATPEFTNAYPDRLGCRVTIQLKDGRSVSRTQDGFEGGIDRPFTWERTAEKFHWLAEPYADAELRQAIIDVVEHLDERALAELTALLGRVHPHAVYPATHPGIQ
jgi:2-methylcitrate dehydratase